MAGIGESQNFEALGSQNARETGSAVRRQVHNLFTAGSAVKTNEGATGINFFLRGKERAVHVPVVAVSVVADRDVFD